MARSSESDKMESTRAFSKWIEAAVLNIRVLFELGINIWNGPKLILNLFKRTEVNRVLAESCRKLWRLGQSILKAVSRYQIACGITTSVPVHT